MTCYVGRNKERIFTLRVLIYRQYDAKFDNVLTFKIFFTNFGYIFLLSLSIKLFTFLFLSFSLNSRNIFKTLISSCFFLVLFRLNFLK